MMDLTHLDRSATFCAPVLAMMILMRRVMRLGNTSSRLTAWIDCSTVWRSSSLIFSSAPGA